jgi:hypothetical protein
MEPTLTLSKTDEAQLARAAENLRAGKPLSKTQQRAIDKRNRVRAQESFISVGGELPRGLFDQITGRLSRKRINSIGRLTGNTPTARSCDLWAFLASVFQFFDSHVDQLQKTPERRTATTYRELADALEMTCADPERTLKQYTARGMPGRPGRPGKKAARFDVEECRLWIAANVRNGTQDVTEGIRDARGRLTLLDLEIKEGERRQQLEQLADVDEIADFIEICVNDAKAILEALPDEILEALPEELPEETRRNVHRRVERILTNALESISRTIEGDTDPTEDDDEDEIPED